MPRDPSRVPSLCCSPPPSALAGGEVYLGGMLLPGATVSCIPRIRASIYTASTGTSVTPRSRGVHCSSTESCTTLQLRRNRIAAAQSNSRPTCGVWSLCRTQANDPYRRTTIIYNRLLNVLAAVHTIKDSLKCPPQSKLQISLRRTKIRPAEFRVSQIIIIKHTIKHWAPSRPTMWTP